MRAQALLLSAVPLVFLVALLVIAGTLQQTTQQAAARSRQMSDALAQADRISQILNEATQSVSAFARSRAPSDLAGYRKAEAAIGPALDALNGLGRADADSGARAARFSRAVRAVFPLLREYIHAAARGDKTAMAAISNRPATRRIGRELVEARNAFDGGERATTLTYLANLRRSVQTLGRALLIVAVVGIVLTLVVAQRFGFGMTRRLRLLAENAHRLAVGEPTLKIPGNDEIAALDSVYRTMAERLKRERRVASGLQRALLPQDLPVIDGLRLDSAYVPASHGIEVGGDWFDVFALSANLVGISVGDVAGHGLRAAVVMGAMRQSIRTAAHIDHAPSAVLRHVNAVLCADDDATLVTAFFGVFDRVRGTLRYGIAGHPPPLLVSPAGTAAPFEGSGVVLGLDARSQYDDFIMPLDAGYGAVFYTDGIIEVERDYFKGMRDLERAVLDELAAPSANVADGIQRRIFAHAEPRDDSALLFVGVLSLVTGADAPTVWQFDARDAVAARLVKRALTWRIGGVTDDADGISAVMLAYGELIGNVARHTPGRARVVLESDGTSRVIHVEDEGTPFAFNGDAAPDAFAESGRGLFIARRVADVRLSRTPRGNRVSIAVPGGTAAS